jgi:hypothetical protein
MTDTLETALRELDLSPDSAEPFGPAETGLLRLDVPGERAVDLWTALRDVSAKTGYFPVLLGGEATVSHRLTDSMAIEGNAPGEVRAGAEGLDADAWLAERQEMMAGTIASLTDAPMPANIQPADFYVSLFDFIHKKPFQTIGLALCPTAHGWQAPVWLPIGGWKNCPPPAVHLALWQRWYSLYGAEPVVMTGSVVEMRVTERPQDEIAARTLAMEQFLYCPDLVLHGTDTLGCLAATLSAAPIWYFWWE